MFRFKSWRGAARLDREQLKKPSSNPFLVAIDLTTIRRCAWTMQFPASGRTYNYHASPMSEMLKGADKQRCRLQALEHHQQESCRRSLQTGRPLTVCKPRCNLKLILTVSVGRNLPGRVMDVRPISPQVGFPVAVDSQSFLV